MPQHSLRLARGMLVSGLPSALALYDNLCVRKGRENNPLRLKIRSPDSNNKGCTIPFSYSDARTLIQARGTIWFTSVVSYHKPHDHTNSASRRRVTSRVFPTPGKTNSTVSRTWNIQGGPAFVAGWMNMQACRRQGGDQRFASLASTVSW
jgi:hypothetical protein